MSTVVRKVLATAMTAVATAAAVFGPVPDASAQSSEIVLPFPRPALLTGVSLPMIVFAGEAGGLAQPQARVRMQDLVTRIVAESGGQIGAAVTNGGDLVVAGNNSYEDSWSTRKVPVAVAAWRSNPSPATRRDVSQAIIFSDNDAATRLWSGMRGQGAANTMAVLQDAHAASPVWDVDKKLFGYAYGDLPWSVSEQATFMWHLPCVAGSGPVLDDMGHVTPDQAYGLGRIPGARMKDGWGTGPHGYTMRQIALIPTAGGGTAGVALIVHPAGGHSHGIALLNHAADQVRAAAAAGDFGIPQHCPKTQ